jgi:hypothetical protein
MTFENVENQVRKNCRKCEIALNTKLQKAEIQVRQNCQKLVLPIERLSVVGQVL